MQTNLLINDPEDDESFEEEEEEDDTESTRKDSPKIRFLKLMNYLLHIRKDYTDLVDWE